MLSSSVSQFSPHNDVLTAHPTTDSEKNSLLGELKSRGRSCVTTSRYPDAVQLYSKAIEIMSSSDNNSKDLAILHSNRALCHLQMNKSQDSYDDAISATCYDPKYLKGFWRLGQACMASGKSQEAVDAYAMALSLDETNKALKKEKMKADKQLEKDKLEEEQRKMEVDEEETGNGMKIEQVEKEPTSTKSSLPSVSDKSKTNKDDVIKVTSTSKEFTKSDHVRGYKIVNGKKTSFFHHEQTEEEKKLIGDITPKRIDDNNTNDTNNNSSSSTSVPTTNDVSAWNKAGTWEEKDVTDWAIKSIQEEIMKKSPYKLPSSSPDPNAIVEITKISKLISSKKAGGSCHASVAKVRSKKKYIFEFTIGIHWKMTLGSGKYCSGEMTFYDVDGTHAIGDGYDVSEYKLESTTSSNDSNSDFPPDARYLLQRFVKDGGLRTEIEHAMDDWIGIFRDTY